jgi:hypothetical protein
MTWRPNGRSGSWGVLDPAWADLGRRLVFVYLTDRLTAGHEGARHQG